MTQVRDSRRRAAATSRRASSRIWSRSTCRQLMQIPKSGTRARAPARARERRCLAIREVKLNKIIRGNRIPFSPQKPNRSSTTTSTSTIPPPCRHTEELQARRPGRGHRLVGAGNFQDMVHHSRPRHDLPRQREQRPQLDVSKYKDCRHFKIQESEFRSSGYFGN
jgi:hypothetical protein